MLYKLKLIDADLEECGEYKGSKVLTEEVLDNCFVIRLPFDYSDRELQSKAAHETYITNVQEFVQRLVGSDALKGKMCFVVPRTCEFMKLERIDD